jgi:hypothetical protein
MTKYTKKEKQSSKQYFREFLPAIIIYVLLILATKYILKGDIGATNWAYVIAVMPMIPIYYVMRAIVRFVRRSDELQKKLHSEASVITLLIVTFFGFAIGLVQYAGGPDIDLFMAATIICPLYFVVFAFLQKSNGDSGCP